LQTGFLDDHLLFIGVLWVATGSGRKLKYETLLIVYVPRAQIYSTTLTKTIGNVGWGHIGNILRGATESVIEQSCEFWQVACARRIQFHAVFENVIV
jgi:hypothetical protein